MSPAEHEIMRSVEDDYWWYRALHQHVLNVVKPTNPSLRLLDAGCGTGGMLQRLRNKFPNAVLKGIDLSERALELTAARLCGADLTQGSVNKLPLPDNSFDWVLSLDVLTAAGVNDLGALRELSRILCSGGRCIVNVAAFDFLQGEHDRAVDATRRYRRAGLRKLLAQAGFVVEAMTYWNMILSPMVALKRWTTRNQGPRVARSDFHPLWPSLNKVLTALASGELAFSTMIPLPLGTSLFAVARKP